MNARNNRKSQQTLLWGVTASALGLLAPAGWGQSADALIDKLVEKGVLTVKEANDLREEADKDFTRAYAVKSGMSDWVNALKLNGDFRGRFEGFYSENPAFVDRTRWRYRLRFGATAALMDRLEVGLRLGSGDLDNAAGMSSGADPISNNQSLQNNASKKGIFLDLAYARWTAINAAEGSGVLTVGKMENPFVFSDLVFDGDYTPEGLGEQLSYNLSDRHALKLNGGQFIVDEIGNSSDDPYLFGGQLRLESVWNLKWTTSLGASFLTLSNVDRLSSASVPDLNAGNLRTTQISTAADGTRSVSSLLAPVNDFDTLVFDAAAVYTLESFPFYPGAFPIRIFGDYLYNTAADDFNTGYQVGLTLGKAGKRRTWEATYRYKMLEGDVWWEELTDSDFGAFYQNGASPDLAAARARTGGYWAGPNSRGHVVRLSYSPLDALTFAATWFGVELIEEYRPNTDSYMNRVQVDAVWKF